MCAARQFSSCSKIHPHSDWLFWKYIRHFLNYKQDKPRQTEGAKAKKTDEPQPDDDEVEEEFEVDEPETKTTSRPASKLDLEEPISSQNDDNDEDNEEDDADVSHLT